MKFNKTVLASVIAFALAGCSDDDTSTGTDTTTPTNPTAASLSGKAADGYLENAEVCLDLNLNKACDSNEPTATTGTNGVFTLDTTQESIDSYPIIVNVIAGQTTDTDNPGVALTKGYVLSAPAKSVFVSPISTLIQNEIENGNSSEDAVAAVQLQLGTDQDVTKDYIAEKNNASLSDEDKAVFDQIHKVAQVTARVMATKLSELESSAAQQGISNKELQSVIAEKVSNVLSDINSQVVSEGDNFDPDTAADTIKDNIDLSPENIKDKVDVNNADKESQKSSLAELIRTEGMLWLSSSKSGLAPTLEYGVVSIDNQGEVIETEYKSNADYTAFDVYTPPSNTDLLLTESGWKLADDTIVGITSNPDGSDTLEMKTTELSLKTKVMKVDVSGLKVSDVMEKTADTQSVWAGLYSESTVFPEGTFAYRLKIESTIDDYFSLYPGAWCDEAYAAERGGMCNAINVEAATGSGSPAQTLDQIYKEASDGSLASTAILAGISNGGVVAEVIADGTVNYFLWDYMNPLGDPIATGSWKDTIVHGKVIREISAPVSITHMDGLLWNNFASNGKVYLSEVEGYVRILAPTSAVNEEEYVFSANSLQSILDSRDEFPTLGACLASLDDADYIPTIGDKITYDAQKEVTWLPDEGIQDFTEIHEFMGTNFSWLANRYAYVYDLPSWVSETDGKLHKGRVSIFNSDGVKVVIEDEYYDGVSFYGSMGLNPDGTEPGFNENGEFLGYGSLRATLPQGLPNASMLLNHSSGYSFDRVNLSALEVAEHGGIFSPFDSFVRDTVNFTYMYAGKETVTVPAGTFETCKTVEMITVNDATIKDVETRWSINQGAVKRDVVAPSWAPTYNRQATEVYKQL